MGSSALAYCVGQLGRLCLRVLISRAVKPAWVIWVSWEIRRFSALECCFAKLSRLARLIWVVGREDLPVLGCCLAAMCRPAGMIWVILRDKEDFLPCYTVPPPCCRLAGVNSDGQTLSWCAV